MSNSKKINDKKIYNSVVKIINTMVELDLTIPFNVVNQAQAEGAGFFINGEGYIVTAAHVLSNSVELWIRIPEKGKKIYRAEIICVYPDFDIGIIHIKDFKNQYWLELGNSESINLRDKV
jgi:S1-C subfamily serine protease